MIVLIDNFDRSLGELQRYTSGRDNVFGVLNGHITGKDLEEMEITMLARGYKPDTILTCMEVWQYLLEDKIFRDLIRSGRFRVDYNKVSIDKETGTSDVIMLDSKSYDLDKAVVVRGVKSLIDKHYTSDKIIAEPWRII